MLLLPRPWIKGIGNGQRSLRRKYCGKIRWHPSLRSEANQQNLIVCIGPGTFRPRTYDLSSTVAHKTAEDLRLTRIWKIHAPARQTILKCQLLPKPAGVARIRGLGGVQHPRRFCSGIEISDLSIDDILPELKADGQQQGIPLLI